MDAEAAAKRWAETLRDAWQKADADALLAVYADDAMFHGPFGKGESACDHMRRVFQQGAPAELHVGEPLVTGDEAAVEWWAVLVESDRPTTYAATAWLRFDSDGLVSEEHDYWNSIDEHRSPPPGWGSRS